jgi:hypothetical protein
MLQYNSKRRIPADRLKATCLKNLKLEVEETFVPLDPMMETIVIPESDQRWINLVPLPPKVKKENSASERRDSKEKSNAEVLANRSNIFSSLENRSVLIPKSRNSQEKPVRVRLPSIQRKNSFQEA